jgi:hypothetical protein
MAIKDTAGEKKLRERSFSTFIDFGKHTNSSGYCLYTEIISGSRKPIDNLEEFHDYADSYVWFGAYLPNHDRK